MRWFIRRLSTLPRRPTRRSRRSGSSAVANRSRRRLRQNRSQKLPTYRSAARAALSAIRRPVGTATNGDGTRMVHSGNQTRRHDVTHPNPQRTKPCARQFLSRSPC
jgi:hypothetical protein